MNYEEKKNYKKAAKGFVDFSTWRNPIALNLNFQQRLWLEPYHAKNIDGIAASSNLRVFFNMINGKLVSRNDRRHGERIGSFAVLERGYSLDFGPRKRWHCHALVECPNPDMIETFDEFINEYWSKTIWGYGQNVVKPCDEGWVSYMTKMQTKADYAWAHDWSVLSLPKKKDS